MIKLKSIFLKLLLAIAGYIWGYFSISHGSFVNDFTGMIPVLVGIVLTISAIHETFKLLREKFN